MAKARAKAKVKAVDVADVKAEVSASTVKLAPIMRQRVTCTIVGKSPMIQHQWGVKAPGMMRDKHAGKKTKNREVRNPQAEGEEAAYRTEKNGYGVPAMAIKAAVLEAAHKDIGIERTLVRKALFIVCPDAGGILPMDCDEPVIREDIVRLGGKSADLRYRPYFYRWSVRIEWELDAALLQVADLLTLIDRAGFGVGIGDWRPEKGGEFGRFEVDQTAGIDVR